MEFEEARRDLELELEKGSSLDEIQDKIIKGNIQAKVSKQLQTKKYFTIERIQRKKRDIMHLLNKYATESVEETLSPAPKAPTTLELWSQAREEQDGGQFLNKKLFKMNDGELLVRWFCDCDIYIFLCGIPCLNHLWNSHLSFLFLKVLATHNPGSGKIKVYVATDLKEPLALHWGLSKESMEWMVRCRLRSTKP